MIEKMSTPIPDLEKRLDLIFKQIKTFNNLPDNEKQQALDHKRELDHEIWEITKSLFILKNQIPDDHRYQGLIFSVGFSKEPIILNIISQRPQSVYFLYTANTERVLDAIIAETGLRPSQFEKHSMQKTSAAGAYVGVKNGLTYLQEKKSIPHSKIALDPTEVRKS